MLPGEPAELSSGPRVQVEPKVNWPVCWLLLELVRFLVDAVFEAGADGMRARRFGQRGGDRVVH